MKSPIKIPEKYVKHIEVDGLKGRMTHLPKKGSKKTIILIHGQHARLERYYALVQYLGDYGEVYAPDLPGFGGMDSFYRAGKVPNFDNYADYLYKLIKKQKIKNNITLVGMSYGSEVGTRMLQKYPDLYDQIDDVIGFVGFGSGSDFDVTFSFKAYVYPLVYSGSTYIGNKLMELIVFNPLSLRLLVWIISKKRTNMKLESKYKDEAVAMEYILWRDNDNRTHCKTSKDMFVEDLRDYSSSKIPFKITNVVTKNDQFFNTDKVQATFLDLYDDYEEAVMHLKVHAPSILAKKQEVRDIMPDRIGEVLSS